MAPAAPTTLPGSLLAAARSTPSRTFIEVWDESEGGSVTIRTLARPSIRPGMRNAVRLYGLIDKPTSQNAC